MTSERSDESLQSELTLGGLLDWRAAFLVGLATAILGIIVAALPGVSLNVIAVLLGVLVIFSGIYNVVEAFRGDEHGRVWRGIAGSATRMGTGWAIFFGVISLIAGIVVISAPIASITTLAVLMGIWFIVMGLMEMFGAFAFRHAVRSTASDIEHETAGDVSVPGQRARGAAGDSTADSTGTGRKVTG